jgi:hypothetical protein
LPKTAEQSIMHAQTVWSFNAALFTSQNPLPSLTKTQEFIGVQLYRVQSAGGTIVGTRDVRPLGGIGQQQLQPLNPLLQTPSVSSGSIALSSEGATGVTALVSFTVNGLSIDDTVKGLAITWSPAGLNQWHPPQLIQWDRVSTSIATRIHSLAGGQGYDFALHIIGQDGQPLSTSPMLIATVTASQVTLAMANLPAVVNATINPNATGQGVDNLFDGVTYGRLWSAWKNRLNSDGTMTSDSSWLQNQISLWTGTTDFVFHATSPSGATSINAWCDSGTDGSSIHFSDQSGGVSTLPNFGTAAAPALISNGLTAGATYYFLVFYSIASDFSTTPPTFQGWNCWISAANTPWTYDKIIEAIKDARYSFIASASTNNTVVVGGGTKTYSGGGSGGRLLR